MDEKTRLRVLVEPFTYLSRSPSFPTYATYTSSPFGVVERTQTRGHGWPKPKTPLSDSGGDFSTIKVNDIYSSDPGSYHGIYRFGYEYQGPEWAVSPRTAAQDALNAVAFTPDANLMLLGTKAIANVLPTNPNVDGATAIGELKEGLPKMIGRELFKTKFKDYRKIGSEYLNVEFGWKPLVSDIQKTVQSVVESEKIINQLHRDSGRNIRRKFTFPADVSTSTATFTARQSAITSSFGTGYPYLYVNTGGSTLTKSTTVETKTWFSGCFTYHINLGTTLPDRISRQAAEARKLYGLELTPATIWNLAPWSWAADWEGTIGDVLHNVSRFSQDGLVMRYGYIMQQKTATIDYTLAKGGRLTGSPKQDLHLRVTSTSKIRRRATPFGFGINMNTLNGRQLSILGALGISRGPRHL